MKNNIFGHAVRALCAVSEAIHMSKVYRSTF